MKVAKKSPLSRRTITLPVGSLALIDELRGSESKSAYLERLLAREKERIEEDEFVAAVNAAYTPEVCAETLRVNEEYPIHGDDDE